MGSLMAKALLFPPPSGVFAVSESWHLVIKCSLENLTEHDRD